MEIETVSFDEVENIFDTYRIWITDNEKYWFQNMWRILGNRKMTQYEDETGYYHVILRAVSLLMLFYEFNHLCYASNELDGLSDTIEDMIPPFVLGQLFASHSDHIIKNRDYAVMILADAERDKLVRELYKELDPVSFFLSLCAVNYTFLEDVEDEDGEYTEEELEPSSADEFWVLFQNNIKAIMYYAENQSEYTQTYDWTTGGAWPLEYYYVSEDE